MLPIALLQTPTNEGALITIPDCSLPEGCITNIDMGTTIGASISSLVIRLSNQGGSSLVVTKSKPPIGGVLFAQDPTDDFSEGLGIAPGSSSNATILFAPQVPVVNSPDQSYSAIWTLNTNDPTFGVHILNFTATSKAIKTGPLTLTGTPLYEYLGCYQDSVTARIEKTGIISTINTNGLCQNQSYATGTIFAGTEYVQECWVGNAVPSPSLLVSDAMCNYQCNGDTSQTCGGDGGFLSLYYDSSRYFPSNETVIALSNAATVGQYKYAGCCKLLLFNS